MGNPNDQVTPVSDDEHEKLRRWRGEFQLDFRRHQEWHDKKVEWERFYDGEQLSAEEKSALRSRNQPEVVINLIKPRIDGVIGDFLGRRVMMRARDRGTADFETAKHVTEALRYIEDQNHFDDQEAEVARDLFVGGQGWYKVSLEFDFLEAEIRVAHRDNNDVIVDRRSRKRDLSDAKRMWETVWVEQEDLIELYPQHEEEIRQASAQEHESFAGSGLPHFNRIGDQYKDADEVKSDTIVDFDTFLDPKRNRIRLINVWERVQKRTEFAWHPDITGQVQEITEFTDAERATLKATFPGVQIFARIRWELNSGIFIFNKILEEKENVRPHDSEGKFPFARAVGHVERETMLPYGMVRQYIDAQSEYNKRRSKLLHKSNVNRLLMEKGAIPDNDIERTRQEAARPDGVLMFSPGKRFEIDRDDPNQVDLYLLQLSQMEIEASGVAKEFIGIENKVMSGKAIGLRQIEGQKMLRPFYAALRAARRQVFSIVLEEIQQYWTSEKLIKITDDPEAGAVVLNQRTSDPRTGAPVIMNNLRLGKYDIKIDEDVESQNQRTERFQMLAQLGQVALQAGAPFPLELLIRSSDLPNKKEWLEAIAQEKARQMEMMKAQLQMQQLALMHKAGAAQSGRNVTPT